MLMIDISQLVAEPEFQVAKNLSQIHEVLFARKIFPIGKPLIENCRLAGLTVVICCNQHENS
jgi:hypothetical protein